MANWAMSLRQERALPNETVSVKGFPVSHEEGQAQMPNLGRRVGKKDCLPAAAVPRRATGTR